MGDFMNMCMEEPTKKKTNKITGKTEGFCLDDFLDKGLKFYSEKDDVTDLFADEEPKPKEKRTDRDSARNERKAARVAKKKKNIVNASRGKGLSLDDLLDSDSTSPMHDTSLDNLFGSNEDVANKEESSKMDYGKESKESVEEKSKDDLRKERNEARKKKRQEARAKIDAAKANSTSQSGQSLDDLFGDGETNANEK